MTEDRCNAELAAIAELPRDLSLSDRIGAEHGWLDWYEEKGRLMAKPYYEHAGITIYHGDCREILPTLPKVDLIVTDPPYGTQLLGGGYGRRQLHSVDGRNGRTIANDNDLSVVEDAAPMFHATMKSDGWAAVFCAARKILDVGTIFRLAGFEYVGQFVWDKGSPGLGYTIRYAHEDALIFKKGDPARPKPAILSVVRSHMDAKEHPHEKPIDILKSLLQFGQSGSLALDPFCGIGSTLRAAKDAGMRAIGIEIEERYCEIAAKRLSQEVFAFGDPDGSRTEAGSEVSL